MAGDIAGLQTERAYQTVADEVAIAYYGVLRSQALRRTAQDALRRAEEQLRDARNLQREGVVERETVLRSEVQRAENRQQLHAATEAEFVALAGLNLAIGLKCNQPVRVAEPTEVPPLATSLADCLQTAIRERREFDVVRRTVEIAVEGGRVARADFAPKVVADGMLLNFQQQELKGHVDLPLGFIRLEWTLFEGGRRIAATRVADSEVRQAMAQAESIADHIAFQVNEAYRNAVTAWVGIDDARPAVDQAQRELPARASAAPRGCGHARGDSRCAGLVDSRPAELPECSLQLPDRDGPPRICHGSWPDADDSGLQTSLAATTPEACGATHECDPNGTSLLQAKITSLRLTATSAQPAGRGKRFRPGRLLAIVVSDWSRSPSACRSR